MDRAAQIKRECDNLAQMLIAKNARYGDSALSPVRVFSRASAEEQILVRIDDKLSRLARGKGAEDEDVILDLLGYLILLRISRAPIEQVEEAMRAQIVKALDQQSNPPAPFVTNAGPPPPRPWREVLAEDLDLPSDAPFKTISERVRGMVKETAPSLAYLCDALRADREAVCNALRIDAESEREAIVKVIKKMTVEHNDALRENRAICKALGSGESDDPIKVAEKLQSERNRLRVRVAELEAELQSAQQFAAAETEHANKWCAKYRAAERAFGWVALKDIRPGTLFETPVPYESGLGLRYPDGRFSWLTGGKQPLEVHAWPKSYAIGDEKTLVLLAGLDGAGCDRIVKAYRSFGEGTSDAEG